MDLFDFFFPEQAQATHLRRLADAQSRTNRLQSGAGQEDLETLIQENRELRLYLTAITQLLVEKGIVRSEEIQAKVLSMLPTLPPTAISNSDQANPFDGFR